MYADFPYYRDFFLLGRAPVVPEEVFQFWSKQAGIEIDRRTFYRLRRNPAQVPEAVRDCTCAVAELMYRADLMQVSMEAEGMTGVVTSYSNDGESATLDISQSVCTESGKKKEMARLVRLYLSGTGLLYPGVDRLEP